MLLVILCPLLCMPSDHSHIARAELFTQDKATGHLVLSFNERASSGILANSRDMLANINR
jgi:xylan 1,4-beta-xylosidase